MQHIDTRLADWSASELFTLEGINATPAIFAKWGLMPLNSDEIFHFFDDASK
ncbi:MAG: hypothetical protein KQH63_16135 [Desulfobulbaceae bacterium]|nr:hypothetical protein [Desulfobulbaceae bacterium]